MSLTQGTKIRFRQQESIPCVESIAELEAAHRKLDVPAVRFVHHAAEKRSFRLRRVWMDSSEECLPVNKSITTESIELVHLQNATLAGDFGLFLVMMKSVFFRFTGIFTCIWLLKNLIGLGFFGIA